MAGKDDPQHRGSGPIQQIPSGLLGFLQLKNNGANPSQLLDEVAPTLDWSRWTLETAAVNYALGTAVGLLGLGLSTLNITPIVVPAREWWWCSSISVGLTAPGAADQVWAAIGVREENTLTKVRILTPFITCAVLQHRYFGGEPGVWLAPGSEFVIGVGFEAGVTWTADVWVRYARLPV